MKKRTTYTKSRGVAEYARHRGASAESIYRAIREGRLHDTIVRDGNRIRIPDFVAADREFERHTRHKVDAPGAERLSRESAEQRAKIEAAQARKQAVLADIAELELADLRTKLVRVEDVKTLWADIVATIRAKVHGLPDRAKQRDASLTAKQLAVLERLLREAIEELEVDPDEMFGELRRAGRRRR